MTTTRASLAQKAVGEFMSSGALHLVGATDFAHALHEHAHALAAAFRTARARRTARVYFDALARMIQAHARDDDDDDDDDVDDIAASDTFIEPSLHATLRPPVNSAEGTAAPCVPATEPMCTTQCTPVAQ